MYPNSKKIAFCVAGWHYDIEFYQKIVALDSVDVFIVSHRPMIDVPVDILSMFDKQRIYFEPNYGYDWGCYQQFLDRKLWLTYDYIFFIHDDVEFRQAGLIPACIDKLRLHAVVGNGRVSSKLDHPLKRAHCYSHSSWLPPSRSFVHDIVRGSFFATTRQSLEILGRFEVFWDRFKLTSAFGNWSTYASCGKWEHYVGKDCFGFLSEVYCESKYLLEHVRGGEGEVAMYIKNPLKRRTFRYVRRIGRVVATGKWNVKGGYMKGMQLRLYNTILDIISK